MSGRRSASSPTAAAPVAGPHWSRQGERGSLAALRLMAWIAVSGGRRVARAILHPITLYFMLFAPATRRRSMRYLGRALGRPAGWRDAYRQLHPETTDECYTWWSNRGQAWAKNVGWRLDYQLATQRLASAARQASVYKAQRFSDHAPLTIDYDV